MIPRLKQYVKCNDFFSYNTIFFRLYGSYLTKNSAITLISYFNPTKKECLLWPIYNDIVYEEVAVDLLPNRHRPAIFHFKFGLVVIATVMLRFSNY